MGVMSSIDLGCRLGYKEDIEMQKEILDSPEKREKREELAKIEKSSNVFRYTPIDMKKVMLKFREKDIHKKSQKIADFCRFIAPRMDIQFIDEYEFNIKFYDFSNSFKHIYSLKETENEKICKMICFYCQNEEIAKKQGVESFDFILSTNFNYYINLYVTKNSFYRDERSNENLFSFDNIVIDIDDHSGNATQSEINREINKLIRALKKLRDNNKFLEFNAVKSGRGVQIWIHLESFSAIKNVMKRMYTTFCEKLLEIVDNVIKEKTINLKTDVTPTMSQSGFVRLPYTYNTKAKTKNGKFYKTQLLQYTNKKYTLDELCEFFGIKRGNAKQTVKKKKFKPYTKNSDEKNYVGLFYKRKNFFEKLVERGAINEGRRNLVMYYYYISCYKIFSTEIAQQLTKQLNNSFKKPLSQSELNATFRSAEKCIRDTKNSTIFKKINATNEEIALYNELTDNQRKRKEKRENAREEKEKRNQTIKELSKEMTVREIANELDCSVETVCKYNDSEYKPVDYNKIIELFKQGLKQKEIAKQVNCAESTVSEVLKPYKKDKKEVIIDLFKQGIKQVDIVKQTGYSKSTVIRVLKEYKIQCLQTQEQLTNLWG